ncbi:MAG TPA: TRAP transporter TatT component family protein [Candidatus Eisenbacteria bacterium]|jgi:predicted anti-sigma-YlaC factor YlaD
MIRDPETPSRELAPPPRARPAGPARARAGAAVLLLALAAASCSPTRFAVNRIGDAVAKSGDVFTSDDDPELVRDAIPFGLKTMESLLHESPRHPGLLLAACQGFTQYAYAFVQMDADYSAFDFEKQQALRDRALKLYLRARGYGLRGLELKHPGIAQRLATAPAQAAQSVTAREQPLLYWTAAAWGAAVALGKDRPDLVADFPVVKALMERALALDENFQDGAIHEALIILEALPPEMGGSVERARMHFERAVAISKGTRPGPFVTLAETVAVAKQDRREFEDLLHRALAIDPEKNPSVRLETVLMQRKARALLAKEDELFIDSGDSGETK